jgi:hypothetical protein
MHTDTIWTFDFDPLIVFDTCECPLTLCERDAVDGQNLCPLCRDYCSGFEGEVA